MKQLIPEPERLVELAPTDQARPAEQRAALLLQGLAEPAALSPELLLRIKSRVVGGPPRRVGTMRVKVLLAAAILIAASGMVFAAQGWWQAAHHTEQGRIVGQVGERGARPSTEASSLPTQPAALEAPIAAPPVLRAAIQPEATEKPKTSLHSPAAAGETVPEARLLGEALVALRRDGNPRAALTLLDQYSERFPNGSLTPEAARARAEALIALGRRADALRVLDELNPAALGRSMLLVRAELRAELNRCSDALGDFSSALAQSPRDSVDERALFGRATCRSRIGDASGARSDLDSYAARFPHGRFQSQVERALQK